MANVLHGIVFVASTIGAILDIVEHSGQCLGYRTVWQRLCSQYNWSDPRYSRTLAGQITRRVAPSVAPSTGCSIIIIILFFRMDIVH